MRGARAAAAPILAVLATTLLVYYEVTSFPFVHYDDNEYVEENPQVRAGLSLDGVRWAFTATAADNWHPLTWLSHMLDCDFFGLRAGGHHLVNLLFHLANATLAFFFWKRATGAVWRSALVAGLFALHPLNVESVAWIAERKNVLSLFFCWLTLLAYAAYVRQPVLRRYLAVVSFFALGLLAKPMVVTLPCVLLLLDFWPLRRGATAEAPAPSPAPERKNRRARKDKPTSADRSTPGTLSLSPRWLVEKVPLFALSALSSVFTVNAQAGTLNPLDMTPLSTRVANAIVSYAAYLAKMVWPARLSVYYPFPPGGPGATAVALSALLLTAITFVAVRERARRPYLLVGWLWYLGTLVPVIGLVQVGGQAVADRYAYHTLLGPFVMVAWGLAEWAGQAAARARAVAVAGVAALAALGAAANVQVRMWSDSAVLFEQAVRHTRDNYFMENNLGATYYRRGQLQEALAHLSRSVEQKPEHLNARFNLAALLVDLDRTAEGLEHVRFVVERRPEDVDARYVLGLVLQKLGRSEEAAVQLNDVLRRVPDHRGAREALRTADPGRPSGSH